MRRTATSASGASLVEVPLAGAQPVRRQSFSDKFSQRLIDEAQDKLAAAVDGDPQTPVQQPR